MPFGSLQRPDVDFSVKGDAISLSGWLSEADRQALGGKPRGVFGTEAASVRSATRPSMPCAQQNSKAMSALGSIGPAASSSALVDAMNLAIINFSTGSAEIAPDSMEIIRRSAEAIKPAPGASTIEIGGHTDNTGDQARNLALSQARADAVKAALVTAGAPAATLVTKGYGDSRPRATNDTEFGRFQNRRIEYTVVR